MKNIFKKILMSFMAISMLPLMASCSDNEDIHVDVNWNMYNYGSTEVLNTNEVVYGQKYKIDFDMNFNSSDIKYNDVSTKIKVYMGDLDCPENEYNLTMKAQESGGGLTFNKMDSTENSNAYEAKFNLPKGTTKFDGFKNTYLIIEVKSLRDFDNTSLTIKLEAEGRNFLFNNINDSYRFNLVGIKADPAFTERNSLIKLSGVSYQKNDYQLNFPIASENVKLAVYRDAELTNKAGEKTISKDAPTDTNKVINLGEIAKEFVGSDYYYEQIGKGPYELYFKFSVDETVNYKSSSFVAKIIFE